MKWLPGLFDRDRPPAPAEASAEDIERYTHEWLSHHPVEGF